MRDIGPPLFAAVPGEGTVAVLELLATHNLTAAPHVAARLWQALAGDGDAIVETVSTLRIEQRAGLSALPDPLPLLSVVRAAFSVSEAELTATERAFLLAAAVCVTDRTEILLAATGSAMADIIESRVGSRLLFTAGHFTFADPRMRVWVHGTASLAERTATHRAMQRAYTAAGNAQLATWHHSLGTLEGDATLVPALLELAEQADAAGDSEWALAIAREAASHEKGAGVLPAKLTTGLIAGRAALSAGLVADAVRWLDRALASSDPLAAARALPAFVHAGTLHSGEVPDAALKRHADRLLKLASEVPHATLLHSVIDQLARASAIAACLHAVHGATAAATDHLAEVKRLISVHQLDSSELCAAWAWCKAFGVSAANGGHSSLDCHCEDDAPESGGLSGARLIARAITLGLSDNANRGRLLLADANDGASTPPGDVLMPNGLALSPLARAYRAITAALLHFWAGDLGHAAREIEHAAASAPVSLPFAGLGVILARRLDVARTGSVALLARSLDATYPASGSASLFTADLVDRALSAYLDGRLVEATTLGSLAAERSLHGKTAPLHVPGVDVVPGWGAANLNEGRTIAVSAGTLMSPEHQLAIAARLALCASDSDDFAHDYASAVAASGILSSSYERAHTEFVIGRACAVHSDVPGASWHLVAAASLFAESDAIAWQRAVEADLAVLPVEQPSSLLTQPILVAMLPLPPQTPVRGRALDAAVAAGRKFENADGDSGPLEQCRIEWAAVLTEKELEVAMLVIEGASNRVVAARLHVSVRTVEVHVGRVLMKLDVGSRVELTVTAHRMGQQWMRTAK